MQISPVSLTVPYLAFTPALLLVTSYFMLGEVPEASGVAGVVVMTAGAYGLNTAGARGETASRRPSEKRARRARPSSSVRDPKDPKGQPRVGGPAFFGRDHRAPRWAGEPREQRGGSVVAGGRGRVVRPHQNLFRKRPTRRRGDDFAASSFGFGWMLPHEPGSRLMLLVAVLWSFTSDLDKMGKQACDTFVVFVAAQRLCMFAPTFVAAAHRRGREA